MWWSSEHGRLFGCGRSGGHLNVADIVGLVDMADIAKGSLGI
jgi:hypothetical protein